MSLCGCLQFSERKRPFQLTCCRLENGAISIIATRTALHSWLFASMDTFIRNTRVFVFQILNHSTPGSIQTVRDGKTLPWFLRSAPRTGPLRMKNYIPTRISSSAAAVFQTLKDRPVGAPGLAIYPWISPDLKSISRTFLNTHNMVRSYLSRRIWNGHHRSEEFSPRLCATTLGISLSPSLRPRSRHRRRGNIFQVEIEGSGSRRNILLISRFGISAGAWHRGVSKILQNNKMPWRMPGRFSLLLIAVILHKLHNIRISLP